jgi:phage terminase large subunit
MTTAQVVLPPKLVPVFTGDARYRIAWGGRGSGKTQSFAKMTAVRGYMWSKAGESGVIVCGREFMNSLDDSSMAEIKAAIRSEPWLEAHYDIGEKYIRTIDGRVEYKFSGLDRNIESIKSKARIKILWVDEAEPVSERAWRIAIPSVREHDSEIWVTYNPEREVSATHKRFREKPPHDCKSVEINWKDNPFFPDVLNKERLSDLENRPESYEHIWEGGFVENQEGAYYAPHLVKAKQEGRIGLVAEDPNLIVRLFADIGGTGAKADNFVFWAGQFVGTEIRWVNHYEQQGQPVSAHLNWMRAQGYSVDRCKIWLPHDGDTQDKVFDTSYRRALEGAGYQVDVVPNQGKGAAMQRVERGRQLFSRMRFDEVKCAAGLKALGWYHEKRDDMRGIGLGPNHDWSSHSADAFGTGCVAYEEPRKAVAMDLNRLKRGIV